MERFRKFSALRGHVVSVLRTFSICCRWQCLDDIACLQVIQRMQDTGQFRFSFGLGFAVVRLYFSFGFRLCFSLLRNFS